MGRLIVQVGLGHEITPRIVAACVERALSGPWGGAEREVLMACPPELLRSRSDTGPRVLTSLHHPVERSGNGVT